MNNRTWYIYCLRDPRTQAIRYVGWSFNPQKRLGDHVRKAKNERTHKANWLNQLTNLSLCPILEVLESGTGNGWAEAEINHISRCISDGNILLNATQGGEGVVGLKFSDESKRRMSNAKIGKKREITEKMQKVYNERRGKKRPKELMKAIGEARKGMHHSQETKEKLRIAALGYKHTDDARKKISDAGKGRHHTAESKELMRKGKVGKPLSDEHRQKLSDAKKGKTLSEEHKEKIRKSSGGWHQTPEAKAKISAARKKKTI